MSIPIRGLKTIRTLAGKGSRVVVPHRAHLLIACLEIEKARCATERTSELRRLAELDTRLREIDAEQEALMESLAEQRKARGGEARDGGVKTARSRVPVPFRIKY